MESKEVVPSCRGGADGVKAPGGLLSGLTLQRLCLGGSGESVTARRLALKMRRQSGLGAQDTRRPEVVGAGLHVGQEPWTQ